MCSVAVLGLAAGWPSGTCQSLHPTAGSVAAAAATPGSLLAACVTHSLQPVNSAAPTPHPSAQTHQVFIDRTCLRPPALAGCPSSGPLPKLLCCLMRPATVSADAGRLMSRLPPGPALSGRLPDSVLTAVSPSRCHFSYTPASEGGSVQVWVCNAQPDTTQQASQLLLRAMQCSAHAG